MSKHTPGPWAYIPSNEHHGPYVTSDYGSTVCDCYTMSHPGEMSTRNGGRSKPIPFMHEMADANARLIAAAPEMLEALKGIQAYAEQQIIDHCADVQEGSRYSREFTAPWDAILAAIAKAEGR